MAVQMIAEPQLLTSVIGELTVSESYFFRHQTHFDAVVVAARRTLANPEARFCIWSAGCAAGEEPYSIALALRDALPSWDLTRITLTGTDVDRAAITTAEAGIYSAWAFRGVGVEWLERGFRRLPDGRFQLLPEVRQLVTFRQAVLQEYLALVPTASLDAIFFRNVSVYLTEDVNDLLYDGFSRVLRPGGLLFVAPTDVRPKHEKFRAALSQDSTVFERETMPPPTSRVYPIPSLQRAITLFPPVRPPVLVTSRTTEGASLPQAKPSSPTADPFRRVDELADRGDLSGALTLLATFSELYGDTLEFHLRRGRLNLASGDATSAVDDFRRVLYLSPDDYASRYWYALALRKAGQIDAARHQLDLILRDRTLGDEQLHSTAECLMEELT